MKRLAFLAATIVLLTGCASLSQPPVSERVQEYYDKNVANQKPALPTRDAAPKMAFLGDSFTAAQGTDPGSSYIVTTAAALGYVPVPFGQGGTGYTNKGDGSGDKGVYLDRVPAVVAAKPDVVVVQGSTNDHNATDQTRDAAVKVYQALKKGLPKATIVAVGPLMPPGADPREVDASRAALRQATATAGIEFVDPAAGKWLQPADGLFVDEFHPNPAGHKKMGALLAAALRDAGVS